MTLIDKIKRLKEILIAVDPDIQLKVDAHSDGETATVFGPFPSFIFLLSEKEDDRFLIHVNADAANMVLYMTYVLRFFPAMVHDGAFAINQFDGTMLFGPDAYIKKDDNVLMFAQDILAKRQQERSGKLIVPEEKQIYLGD